MLQDKAPAEEIAQYLMSVERDHIELKPNRKRALQVVTFEHAGEDIANELREVPPGSVSASEAGWQKGFDLMAAAWTETKN